MHWTLWPFAIFLFWAGSVLTVGAVFFSYIFLSNLVEGYQQKKEKLSEKIKNVVDLNTKRTQRSADGTPTRPSV